MLRMLTVAVLGLAVAPACGAEELVAVRVQKVIEQPSGADGCPPPCRPEEKLPDGSIRICISNGGGCETIEMKVEHDFLGSREPGSAWTISKRVGEWGPAFPVTSNLIVVYRDALQVRWAPAVLRDGQVLVHPERFVSVLRYAKSEWFGRDTAGMVPVEQVIDRLRAGK